MNVNDFSMMWRGKRIASLDESNAHLLRPIDERSGSKKRALLLIHGFGSSPAVYRLLTPELTKVYDRVVCPVLPGHAESLEAFANTASQDWLAAMIKSAETLAASYESLDIMGLSLGGLLALEVCARVSVNHLFLLAPAIFLQGHTHFLSRTAQVLRWLGLKYIPNHAGNIREPGHAELCYRKLALTAIIEIFHAVHTYQFVPPTCPTDVFLGRYDEVVDSNKVAKCFEGLPHATCHWLEHSAHVLPLDGDVDVILRQVLAV